jgi:hypothetical protein
MLRIGKGTMVFALMAILTVPGLVRAADLSLTALAGTWHNTDPNTGGIVAIIITDAGGIQIQTFSACSPDLCDWGVVNGAAYGRNESSVRATTFLAHYDPNYGESVMTGSRTGPYLRVEVFTKFREGSGRSDTVWAGVFTKE